MNQSLWKKAIAVTLAASMTVGLAACGQKGDSSASADGTKKYFKATYLDNLPDTFTDSVGNIIFKGDVMYYGASNEDYTKYGIYSYNLVSGEATSIYEIEQQNGDDYSNVSSYAVADDGSIYLYIYKSEIDESSVSEDYSNATLDDVLAFFEDEWGYSEEDAENDWNNYYVAQYTEEDGTVNYGRFLVSQKASRISTSYLVKVDASGNVVYEHDATPTDGSESNCNGMAVDKDGNVYISMNTWNMNGDTIGSDTYYTLVMDAEGNQKGKIEATGYTSKLVTLADGRVASVGWGESGNCELKPLDASSMKEMTDQIIEVPSDSMSILDDKNILMTEGASVYKYNVDTKENEEYFNWMDCNISSSMVTNFGILSDGTIAAFIQNWNSSGNQSEIAIIKEVDASEVAQTTNLTLACMWCDSYVEEKIIAFNKSQDKYHITMKTYGDGESEYEDAVNKFTTAIVSDNSIDLVLFENYSQTISFAAKGLNADLYELIDNDADLSRDDFLPNILTACEHDGKLVSLPLSFTLQTVIGKTSDVGDKPGWTFDDMKALLASKPEGTQLFYGMDRTTALTTLMSLGYNDFIDWENTTCHFDSPEFIDVLEFAAMFPETFEWTEDSEDSSVLLNQGKLLLDQYYLGDFEQVQIYRTIFGGDTTFIGYPTNEGNGAMLNLNSQVGISVNCKDKEGAWQFLRTLYLPKSQEEEDNYGYYGFSVRKDDFEKYCENAMKQDEDNAGGTWGWGSFEVEVQPATQADVDQVKDLVYNTTAVNGAVSNDITNIIKEEAAAYFSGQKSAEDVAAIIQSRMQVYLSETK